jgi:hypothetical protein
MPAMSSTTVPASCHILTPRLAPERDFGDHFYDHAVIDLSRAKVPDRGSRGRATPPLRQSPARGAAWKDVRVREQR